MRFLISVMGSTVYISESHDDKLEKIQEYLKRQTGINITKAQITRNALDEYFENLQERNDGFNK